MLCRLNKRIYKYILYQQDEQEINGKICAM